MHALERVIAASWVWALRALSGTHPKYYMIRCEFRGCLHSERVVIRRAVRPRSSRTRQKWIPRHSVPNAINRRSEQLACQLATYVRSRVRAARDPFVELCIESTSVNATPRTRFALKQSPLRHTQAARSSIGKRARALIEVWARWENSSIMISEWKKAENRVAGRQHFSRHFFFFKLLMAG